MSTIAEAGVGCAGDRRALGGLGGHVEAPQSSRGAQYLWRRFRRNRLAVGALAYLAVIHVVAIAGPLLGSGDPEAMDLLDQFAASSWAHPLGTDETGRDVLARVIVGARTSLAVGLAAMTIAITIGTTLGSISGLYGGSLDAVIMRLTDGMLTVPTFFLALMVLAVFGSSTLNVVLVIGVTGWMVVARVVRAEILRTMPQDFIVAARALGVGAPRLLTRHLLPQAVPSLIVAATLGVAYAVLTESALSYLGLGVQPPTPTWGNMLTGAQHYVWKRPILAFYPGAVIMLTVLSYNALGDALSDTLDPRHAGN